MCELVYVYEHFCYIVVLCMPLHLRLILSYCCTTYYYYTLICTHNICSTLHILYPAYIAKTPGGNLAFEAAPFKLTAEMVELMGGVNRLVIWVYGYSILC